jgi:hypothetical protein
MLYNTSPEEAEKAKDKLTKALADLLDADDNDVNVVFVPEGDHVKAKFVVENPFEEHFALCESKELPTKLVDKIVTEDILPNQEGNFIPKTLFSKSPASYIRF